MAKLDKRAELRRRKRLHQYSLVAAALAVVALLLAAAWALSPQQPGPPSTTGRQCATIVMPQGEIKIVIYGDLVPTTAARFSGLFQGGYYNGLTWHRVENWVIQTGQGDPRDPINLEINPTVKNVRGSVGAARTTDPNSATTQFYILKNDASHLDGEYSIFGTVLSGMTIVDNIALNEVVTRSTLGPCP